MKDIMSQKREQLKTLLGELKTFEDKVNAGETPKEAEAEAMDTKAKEAEDIQKEIETHDARMKRIRDQREKGSKLIDPDLPTDEPDTKHASRKDTVAGYMTLGNWVLAQAMMRKGQDLDFRQEQVKIPVPKLLRQKHGTDLMVPLDRKQRSQVMEIKAVPTIADDVIEPDRLPDLVRTTEHDRLVLRDILNTRPTNSDSVGYVRLSSYTRAADRTAHGAVKPEAAMAVDFQTEIVDTIAVHIPVHDQQLADFAGLAGIINGELLYDLDKRVEELVIWGDGVTSHFTGLAEDPNIQAFRTEAGDTLIDTARRGITDVRVSGYDPNVFLVHPIDWEDIVLEKGTDDRYVWTVVTDGATQRLWGVRVVETVACEDTIDTLERVMIVGDSRIGSTLWDRMQAQIAVGWIDDQFIRNMRTIRAELRAAWTTQRPDAWRVHQTEAPTS